MRAPSGQLTRNQIIPKYIAKFHPCRRTCRPCGFTMKISSWGLGLFTFVVRNTITDGMGTLIFETTQNIFWNSFLYLIWQNCIFSGLTYDYFC